MSEQSVQAARWRTAAQPVAGQRAVEFDDGRQRLAGGAQGQRVLREIGGTSKRGRTILELERYL